MSHNPYFLHGGSHKATEGKRCAMEWVSYLAGEDHSDSPVCVSPVLREFGISPNHRWDDEQRQKLRPYLARCIGTAGDGRDMERSWLAADWLLREFLPAFLHLVPSLTGHAAKIRACPPVFAAEELGHCMNLVYVARVDAARAAAGAAAWDAAGAAARDAARGAAWDAAWGAAWDAALDAAWDAAWAAAGAAAWAAARDAAWAAAWDAARDAAWDAAWDALEPTVKRLRHRR